MVLATELFVIIQGVVFPRKKIKPMKSCWYDHLEGLMNLKDQGDALYRLKKQIAINKLAQELSNYCILEHFKRI